MTVPRSVAQSAADDSLESDVMIDRVRAEYLEMPGLRLTPWQAARLWSIDDTKALALLRSLTDAGFLSRTVSGAFVRRSDT
jgi:hypothetical protein